MLARLPPLPLHCHAYSRKTRPVLPDQRLDREFPGKDGRRGQAQEEMSLPIEAQHHRQGEGLPVTHRALSSFLPLFKPHGAAGGECLTLAGQGRLPAAHWQLGMGQVQGCASQQSQTRPRWWCTDPVSLGHLRCARLCAGPGATTQNESEPSPALTALMLRHRRRRFGHECFDGEGQGAGHPWDSGSWDIKWTGRPSAAQPRDYRCSLGEDTRGSKSWFHVC